jgi:alcohol dehydrogenase class IV
MPYAQTLRQAGIAHSELPLLAREAMKVQRLLDHNPRPIGYEDALAIYQAAF